MKLGFLRKKWVRATLGLGVAFGAVAWGAQDGYNVFETSSGTNLACTLDPTCRRLTPGETAMAKEIFGDSIDYKHVKIFSRPILPYWRPKADAYTWKGDIYVINPAELSGDYSKGKGKAHADLLMHEMTHVWQFRNEPAFLARSFLSLARNHFVYDSLYGYDISQHKKFLSYNFEQQAQIVENYAFLRQDIRDMAAGGQNLTPRERTRAIRTECTELGRYRAVISTAIPQKPLLECRASRHGLYLAVNRPAT